MFKHQLQKFVSAVALVAAVGLMAPAISMAGAPSGSGPNDALTPTGTLQHLNVGQDRWYAFRSAGADKDDNPSHVLITLYAQPDGSARFNIWTDDRLALRAASTNPNKDAPPVGEGTKLTYKSGDETLDRFNGALVWAEGFKRPGTYYVQVQQTGPQATDYTLNINGDAITFPTAPQAAPSAGTSGQSAAPVLLPETGTLQAGSSMNMALNPTGATMTVKPGQQQWYMVQVPGNRDRDAHPTVLAELKAQQAGAAKFTVWTADRLHARAISADPDKDAPAVGAGTVQTYADGANTLSRFGGDLIWKGDGRNPATYYIVVEPTGSTPAQYQLSTTLTQ